MLNHPGAKYRSDQYNLRRQAWTVRFAMLDWLQRPEMRDGIWKNIVAKHFLLNRGKVVAKVQEWARIDSLITQYNDVGARRGQFYGGQNLLQELESALEGVRRVG